MKSALALQRLSADGPACLATWLHLRAGPFELRKTEVVLLLARALGAHVLDARDARDALARAGKRQQALAARLYSRWLGVLGA